MVWLLVSCILFGVVCWWLTSGPEFVERKKDPPILDRKARFALYVQGERQLMADWEAAFDPLRAELERKAKGIGGGMYMRELQKYDAKANSFASPVFDAYFVPLDRDQCKLEADAMLSHALITEREYGPRIARCNQEMQA
jgi:hypothetical protein